VFGVINLPGAGFSYLIPSSFTTLGTMVAEGILNSDLEKGEHARMVSGGRSSRIAAKAGNAISIRLLLCCFFYYYRHHHHYHHHHHHLPSLVIAFASPSPSSIALSSMPHDTYSLPFIPTPRLHLQASFIGAIAIADLVKTTLGPKGMDKILQSVSSRSSSSCCCGGGGGDCCGGGGCCCVQKYEKEEQLFMLLCDITTNNKQYHS